ncbi:MAG: Smr/MutS family protein [Candidatus Rokubacteria bacterium]|nr:Smr/MutS family protein [Candidatus Rokubacteria bacterium]
MAAARAGRAHAVADEPVPIPIEDALDLHAFAPRDIPAVVADYLDIGVQRRSVRSVRAAHPLVAGFAAAPPARGGWGATLVRLRPR